MRNLIFKAGVSRYKDHGDFMNAFIHQMKLVKVVQLVDRQLHQLDRMQADLLFKLQERNNEETARSEKRQELLLTGIGLVVGLAPLIEILGMFHAPELVTQITVLMAAALVVALIMWRVFKHR
jgi:hypothetical protein